MIPVTLRSIVATSLLLLLACSSQYEEAFATIEHHLVDVDGDSNIEELSLRRPETWENDPGDYTTIHVKTHDGRTLQSEQVLGTTWSESVLEQPMREFLASRNMVNSHRLLVLGRSVGNPPIILAFEWPFGSTPSRVVGLVASSSQLEKVFEETINIVSLEFVATEWRISGRHCYPGANAIPMYAPTLVWEFDKQLGSYSLNEDLSRAASIERQGVWNGVECGDETAVVKTRQGQILVMPRVDALRAVGRGEVSTPNER